MPRRGGGGRSAPSRPSAPSRAPAPPAQQQRRPASTAAAPHTAQGQQHQQQAGQQRSPGLFGQMASTAAGVAVGSSIGHAIGGFFGGGRSAAEEQPTEQQTNASAWDNQYNAQQTNNAAAYGVGASGGASACEMDAKNFTQCMDEHRGNMQICGWYLEQLKLCQQAAGRY